MKSPWKFLTQFTSRRPSEKTHGNSDGNNVGGGTIKFVSRDTPVVLLRAPDNVSAPDVEESQPSGSAARATPPESEVKTTPTVLPQLDFNQKKRETEVPDEPSTTIGGASVPVRVIPSITRAKVQTGVKENRIDAAARTSIATNQVEGLQGSSSADSFSKEATSLDEEIKRLKVQLAHKLHLQNAQLKKMLERFGDH